MKWIIKMAWRENRALGKSLWLLIFSISIGIAALVAVNSLQDNLRTAVHENSKTLVGADIVLRSRRPIPTDVYTYLEKENVSYSDEVRFNSMIVFPKTGDTRLAVIRALNGDFPYYGNMVTEPTNAANQFRNNDVAVLEESLFHQFDLSVGETVRIGRKDFQIGGRLIKNAGERMGSFFAAPPVYIAGKFVGETKLIQTGSLQRYRIYIHETDPVQLAKLTKTLTEWSKEDLFRIDTPEEEQGDILSDANELNQFLNLAAFIVLLLGGIGVASAVHIYIQQKKEHMAILKCLGATGRQGLAIYSFQAFCLGLFGAVLGTVIGVGLQAALSHVVAPYLPIPLVFAVSGSSIAAGFIIGIVTAFLFSLLSLVAIEYVSPLMALRESEGGMNDRAEGNKRNIILGLIVFLIFLFAWIQMERLMWSIGFVVGLAVLLGIFWGTGTLLSSYLRKKITFRWPYILRQGLSNLYRPHNQTILLLMCLGFGVSLILVVVLTHRSLLNKFDIATHPDRPNMGLFDIRKENLAEVEALVKSHNMPVLQTVPIVSMRLHRINNTLVSDLRQQENRDIPGWTLRRQYRSTYRSTLNNNERVVEGAWHGKAKAQGPPYSVSIEKDIADDLEVGLNDILVFDVAGRLIETVITSIRVVDWYQIQPTFFMVFSEGVLEEAPQFHVLSTHAPSSADSAHLQRAAARMFPDISIIDLRLVLDVVDNFLSQVSLVIRFVTGLIIATGFIMMVGTLSASKVQRLQESILLRTIGAESKQIILIHVVEFSALGLLAVLTGIIPAMIGGWAITEFFFESQFSVDWFAILSVSLGVILLTLIISMLNFRSILKHSPMEVLREP